MADQTPPTEDQNLPDSTPAPVPDPTATPEPGVSLAPSESPAPSEAPKPSKAPWFMERIGELTAREKAEKARADSAEAKLAALHSGNATQAPIPSQAPQPGQSGFEDAVTREVEVRAFNARSNVIAEKGRAEFGEDFAKSIAAYSVLADDAAVSQFVAAAVETGEAAHKVLHHLGSNPDEAKRLMGLSPVKMGIEMDRLATKLSAAPPAKADSQAPAPIKPVGGRAMADVDPDKMSTAEWVKWREADVAKKRANGDRIH